MTAVRVRGIYATALTSLLGESGHAVVQASPPIRRRVDDDLPVAPLDCRIETTDDRQGVACSGPSDAVAAVRDALVDLGRDALAWRADAPLGAIFEGRVTATRGRGAVVDLGSAGEGYLPFADVDARVEVDDAVRVQVADPAPPWLDDRPLLTGQVTVGNGVATLRRGRSGPTAAVDGEAGQELVGLTDLLPAAAPEGWGLRWERPAVDADLDAMGDALADLDERAATIDASLDGPDAPEGGQALAPMATIHVWFGRETRFALDDWRADVTRTMPGHHRVKAGAASASDVVDYVERLGVDIEAFPVGPTLDQFGPAVGDSVTLVHGKPDGRRIELGRAEVTDRDADEGALTLRRELRSSGTYDGLGVPREAGDVATTKVREGRWWYPTTYRSADGDLRGTYVNVCTPTELFPDSVRYVDLHVDVLRYADGSVEVVDEAELDAAVDAGRVPADLAEQARAVAERVATGLGGEG